MTWLVDPNRVPKVIGSAKSKTPEECNDLLNEWEEKGYTFKGGTVYHPDANKVGRLKEKIRIMVKIWYFALVLLILFKMVNIEASMKY